VVVVGLLARLPLVLLMSHVVADRAADRRAGQRVVVRQVAGDAAHHGAFQAAAGVGGSGRSEEERKSEGG
jgi:hypothetical protein